MLSVSSGVTQKQNASQQEGTSSSSSTAAASGEGSQSAEAAPPEETKEDLGLSEEEVAKCMRYLKNRFLVVPGHAFPNLPCDLLEVIPNMGNQLNLLSLVCKNRGRQAGGGAAAAAATAQKPQEMI